MISKDIAANIAEKLKMSKGDAKTVVESVFDQISGALSKGEKVTIKGVGSLAVVDKKARLGRNPSTGEPIQIPAKKNVKFNIATDLKERLVAAAQQ